jgi:Putative peptidase family
MNTTRTAPRAGLVLLALATTSCLFDSRWIQARQSQASVAQHAAPAELRATPPSPPGETSIGEPPPRKAARVLKVRARATTRYAAEVIDWPRQLAELLDDAAEILTPTLSIRLEIAEATPWSPRAGDDDLASLVDELAATDPGADVDWVIGLVGALPRVEVSLHQLGMGRVMGKHFVMRAMNDAREYEAIERSFTQLGEVERRKLYRARKRHKTTTVFLHELGHTLGAPHELDVATIMHADYDPRAQGFSDAAAGLMRLTLEHRLAPSAQTDRAFEEALLAHVKASAAVWVPSERDEMVARLQTALAPPATPTGSRRAGLAGGDPQTPGRAAAAALVALSAADRDVYDRASAAQRAGSARDAWLTAKPLFTAYPDVYAVQDLRCQLAMSMGGAWKDVQAECAPLMTLGHQGKRP